MTDFCFYKDKIISFWENSITRYNNSEIAFLFKLLVSISHKIGITIHESS